MNYVPYRGSGPAMVDLVAGQIDLMVDRVQTSSAHVKGGTIKAFAVAAPKRSKRCRMCRRSTGRRAGPAHVAVVRLLGAGRHAGADREEA